MPSRSVALWFAALAALLQACGGSDPTPYFQSHQRGPGDAGADDDSGDAGPAQEAKLEPPVSDSVECTTLDPEQVYLIGSDGTGRGTGRGFSTIERPNALCVSIHQYAAPLPAILRDGQIVYIDDEERQPRLFRPDPLRPDKPIDNDVLLDNPCGELPGISAFGAPDHDEPLVLCDDNRVRQYVDGEIVVQPMHEVPLAMGMNGSRFERGDGNNGWTFGSDGSRLRATGETEGLGGQMVAARAHDYGFRFVSRMIDPVTTKLYSVDDLGMVKYEATYPPPPEGFPDEFAYGVLDAAGNLYETGKLTPSGLNAVARFEPDGDSEILVTGENVHQGWRLLTGP